MRRWTDGGGTAVMAVCDVRIVNIETVVLHVAY